MHQQWQSPQPSHVQTIEQAPERWKGMQALGGAMLALGVCGMTTVATGCAGDPLPVYVDGDLTDSQAEAIEEASWIIGRPIERADRAYGAVRLHFVRRGDLTVDGGPVIGFTGTEDRCRREIWAVADGRVVAHEIGHAFSLGHVDDESDVMFDRVDLRTWAPEQIRDQHILDDALDLFAACWAH